MRSGARDESVGVKTRYGSRCALDPSVSQDFGQRKIPEENLLNRELPNQNN